MLPRIIFARVETPCVRDAQVICLKVETLHVKKGERPQKQQNKTKHKTKQQTQNPQARKPAELRSVHKMVRQGETRELLQLATRASKSRLSCCSCLWSGFVRSGLVRTGLIPGLRHRSARKHSNSSFSRECQFSSLRKGAVPKGSQGARVAMNLLEYNAFLALANS